MGWGTTGFRGRCGVLIVVAVAALMAAPLLASRLAGLVLPWGLAVGLVGAAVGFAVSTRGLLSRPLQWAAVLIPCVIACVYALAWETRAEAAHSLNLWLLVAAVGAAATLLLADSRVKPSGTHCLILLLAALTWWTGWGLAMTAASVPRPDEGVWVTCASNLKQIGVARLQFEDRFGRKPDRLQDMVRAGLVPKRMSVCPLGSAYVELFD